MKRSTLAARLIAAGNNRQRQKLLAAHSALADVGLASELKDHCYRVWTTDPADARRAAAASRSLADFNPDHEIIALGRWVQGIADITSGKLESAVDNLDEATRLLRRLGREHESAQPMVAKLIALAMLGRYDAAERTGEKALEIFQKYDDQLAAGKIEMNLSNLVSRRDQYKAAERFCLSAYRRFKKINEPTWRTMAENGLANTYAQLNDFDRAEKFYADALHSAVREKMRVTVAEIEASMGNLALFRGRYAEAIRMLELSRQKYEKLGMPHQTAVAELEIADIYAELNLTSEATELYQRLIPTLRRLKMRAEEARARSNFGRALIAAQNPRGARAELKRSIKLFELEKNVIAASAVALRLASLEMLLGRCGHALSIVDGSTPVLERSENVRLRLAAHWLRGEILSRLERYPEARGELEKVIKDAQKFEQPALAQRATNSLGVLARETGDLGKAQELFEMSIGIAEAARAPLPGEEFRMAFLAKSIEPFENLTRLYLDRGDIEKAFVSVERARSRSLLEAVTSGTNGTRTNPEQAKLREELNWFYSRLARADENEIPKLQREVRKREEKLATISLRLKSSNRRESHHDSGEIDIAALQRRLGKQTAMIEFVQIGKAFSAFVITDSRVEYVDSIDVTDADLMTLLEGLHFQFGALRFGIDALGPFAGQLKARSDGYLKELYERLLKPAMRFAADRNLVIVPAKGLNYVPFHALFDGEHYIIESREVASAPSAAVWMSLVRRTSGEPRTALLMAYADERIPLVNQEVDELADSIPGSIKLAGRKATFGAFKDTAGTADLIHLACHGQFRPDNPMFSGLHLADGWVTVRDVVATRLNAKLVTLSACETGLSKVSAGEEILGLARGFLSAGARSLVLSLWTVNDAATTKLMKDFYYNLQRGMGAEASLRLAQIAFIEQGQHPYYWSPFFVIG
jgi:tetratricopeptide (TPR) repeat protein